MKKNPKPLNPANVKLLIIHCSGSRCNKPFTVKGLIATGEARFDAQSEYASLQPSL